MAAFSTLVCFAQLLEQLLDSDQFYSHAPYSDIQSLREKIRCLQSSIGAIFPAPKNSREAAESLENEVRDAVYEAQDAVERFLSQKSPTFSLQDMTEKIDPIITKATKLADSIREDRTTWLDEDIPPPPRSGLISRRSRIVGQENDKKLLMQELLLGDEDRLQVIPITGMAGIGKTTLARSLYDDPEIKSRFSFRAWVTVSQDYHVGDVLARLLNSMESRGQKAGERVYEASDEQLKIQMHQTLYNNKYLVVIDDMWDLDVWNRVRNFLPDNKNGSRIILTTRISSIAESVKSSDFHHKMGSLDEDSSWILLCDMAFLGKSCPPHLEGIGREIATSCKGLPLSLTVIGGLLSQERPTVEFWKTFAEDTNAAAMKGEDAYLEILSLSYNQLPAKLKGCFLYLGAFPEDSDINVSKLIKLWIAEGFLELSRDDNTMEKVAEDYLSDLAKRNLISVRKKSSDGRIKTCGLHDSLRELAVLISGREKFFHCISRYRQNHQEINVQMQRRISVHRNILMCLEEMYRSTKSIEGARSLLYVGSHHHHPLPFCLTYDLLRVLDAFTVYFIDFPDEVLQLIHLRYLSLTYNDDLPARICQLQNLQVLMVRRQPKIIFVGVSFLPDEIWEMPQLRHLWLTETDFPPLPRQIFYNLQSLSNINAGSCTREVLRRMPSLKKLGMWVESPGVVGLYLDELEQLEAFKFTVMKYSPKKQVEFHPTTFFPPTLRKLSLSGCGLPWEDMEVIAALPNLEVLKLRELAFNGEEWSPEYEFNSLKYLLIEFLNFKIWGADESNFPSLERLILRHCYGLQGIPQDLGYIAGLELIELVDCSPDAMKSAEEIKNEQEEYGNERLQVLTYCSYK